MVVPFKHSRILFWIGLVAIVALYCTYYLYFIYGLSREIPLRAMHFMKFVFILAAYGLGVLGLRGRAAGWKMRVWHWVYLAGLCFLVGLGVYDWAVDRVVLSIRGVADTVLEFLVSPVLYVGLGLLARSLDASAQRKGL